MSYQGFDKSPAISDSTAQNLWDATPFFWYGFYLGGPCYPPGDRATDGKAISFTATRRTQYTDIGFNLAYIYVGRQDQPSCHAPSSSNATSLGESDALEAASFASDRSVPSLSIIYLDVEGGSSHTQAMKDYVGAWVAKINSSTAYWAGIYCSAGSNGSVAQELFDACDGKANMWVAQYQCAVGQSYDGSSCFNPSCTNPASINSLDLDDTSYSDAYMRQYAGEVEVNYNNECVTLDLDVSRDTNPNTKQY